MGRWGYSCPWGQRSGIFLEVEFSVDVVAPLTTETVCNPISWGAAPFFSVLYILATYLWLGLGELTSGFSFPLVPMSCWVSVLCCPCLSGVWFEVQYYYDASHIFFLLNLLLLCRVFCASTWIMNFVFSISMTNDIILVGTVLRLVDCFSII